MIDATWKGRWRKRIRNRAKDGMVREKSSAGTLTDHAGLSSPGICPAGPPGGVYKSSQVAVDDRIYPCPNINRQTTTEATTPVASAIKPAAIACRVRRTATAPKYNATT